MSLFAHAASCARSALWGFKRAPFVHLLAVLTIGITLTAAGGAAGAARLIRQVLQKLQGEISLTVYLKPEATPEEARALASSLHQQSGGSAEVISPEQALARLAQELGPLGTPLQGLNGGGLPLSIEVRFPANSPLEARMAELRAQPIVADLDYAQQAVERFAAISRAAEVATGVALAVAVVASVMIISAMLQLAIHARREEIEIQRLVGATRRYVRAPFLVEGILQGLLGSAMAAGILLLAVRLHGERAERFLSYLVGPAAPPTLLDPALLAILAATGVGLGFIGSWMAVGKSLRG